MEYPYHRGTLYFLPPKSKLSSELLRTLHFLSMAASYSYSSSSLKCSSLCSLSPKPLPFQTLFFPFLLFSFSIISISLLFFSIFKRLKKKNEEDEDDDRRSQTSISTLQHSLSRISSKTQNTHQLNSTQSIHLEVLPSNSPNWGAMFSGVDSGPNLDHSDEAEVEDTKTKKKKKRVKKKQSNCYSDLQLENGGESIKLGELGLKNKEELVCLYPFTSSSSATQRKIKQQYDQLVKSHESKGLTLAQVGQFVNFLVDARNELQQKSECIKRKYTITKALLLRADRSSFDRLRQQICKLEVEQKRLEEDAFVYNWLQHQLKLSPAYKKMVEIGDRMELKAKSSELTESPDTDQDNVSFEEFLAQEKKDIFWQKKYVKPKSFPG